MRGRESTMNDEPRSNESSAVVSNKLKSSSFDPSLTDDEQVEQLLNKWREKFKRGFLRFIVLRMFCEKDKNGEYRTLNGLIIRERIAKQTNNDWMPSPGSIYPVLSEMERDGLITQVSMDETRKKFKWYRITPVGLRLISLLRKDSVAFRPSNEVFSNPELLEEFKRNFKSYHQHLDIDELKRLHKLFQVMTTLVKELIDEKERT